MEKLKIMNNGYWGNHLLIPYCLHILTTIPFLLSKCTEQRFRESGIQSYRATELRDPFFFRREKKLQSYRVTELRDTFFFRRKKKLQSYRVTELQATPPGNQEF